MVRHGPQRVLRHRLSLWPAKVGHQDHLRPFLAQQLDGGERLADAGVVGDDDAPILFLGGHVEIHAHEHALAGHVQVPYGEFQRMMSFLTCRASRASARSGCCSPTRCRTSRPPSGTCRPGSASTRCRRCTNAGCRRCPCCTSGSSEYSRMPASEPVVAAALKASLTSLTVAGLLSSAVKSVTDPSGRRHAEGAAVELAFQRRDDLADRLRGAGRGGDDIDRGGAGAAQVLVRQVQDALVVRVRVDRAHEARPRCRTRR